MNRTEQLPSRLTARASRSAGMHNNRPQTKTRSSNSHTHNGATNAYWRSVQHCVAQPDGITEIAHANGLVESFDMGGRPLGLYRLRGAPRSASESVPKRGDLKMLPCHKIVAGPSVIKADGMWRILYRDGITERFAATRQVADAQGEENRQHRTGSTARPALAA